MRAKKSLGQHYLRSEKALATIIKAGGISRGETVLEIGPGEGVLTEKLLACSLQVIAVEKDNALFDFLKTKFKREIENKKLILINDDILNFDLSSLQATSYKLIANIPYNITGAILEKFLSAKTQPALMVLLVQKEVAKRIVGSPLGGSTSKCKESILSISVKAYGTPKYVETVKAGSFVPAPKVDSAVISIENISKEFFKNFKESDFFKMLKAGFKAKRKKLSSNLSTVFAKKEVLKAFQELNLDENTRAEDVDLETWQKLAKNLI